MADKNIKSVLLEDRTFAPPPAFAARARVKKGNANTAADPCLLAASLGK